MEYIIILLIIIVAVVAIIVFYKAAENKLINAKAEAEARLAEMKTECETRLANQKAESTQILEQAKSEWRNALEEQRQSADKQLADAKSEHRTAFDNYVLAAEKRMTEIKADAEKQLNEQKSSAERLLTEAKSERDHEKDLKNKLIDESTELKAKLESTTELLEATRRQAQKDEQERQEKFQTELRLAREQMRAQFEKEMTERADILKREAQERMTSLKQSNTEQMSQIVDPLKKELEQLRRLVDDNKTEQAKNTTALEASIKAVFEHDKERDKTTQSLADALKNRGKVQGDWGEQVLENILRDSGLREGEEFVKQYSLKNEAGADVRPDVIVNGADGSRIIIDSKVSLTAYTDYVGAETDEERTAATKANYDSIWQHVVELSDKKYHKEVDKAIPMVLMFVPNEGSYILAMNRDPQLGAKAYRKGVLIINPTNLMVVLRLMFLTWQNTRQEKNNREILSAASKMYDKYCVFVDGYVSLGNQLNTARNTYEKGMNQLKEGRGNLSKQMEDLRQYGVTPTKQIPEKMRSLTDEEEE